MLIVSQQHLPSVFVGKFWYLSMYRDGPLETTRYLTFTRFEYYSYTERISRQLHVIISSLLVRYITCDFMCADRARVKICVLSFERGTICVCFTTSAPLRSQSETTRTVKP